MADWLDLLPVGAAMVLAGLVGIILGSFIATLILRWPRGEAVWRGRSRCDHCARVLKAGDLVPLLSAWWAHGRCRSCGGAIDPLHWQVELAGGAIGIISLMMMPGHAGWLLALFGWLLLPLILLDARHMWLPDLLTGILAVAGLFLAGGLTATGVMDRLLGAIVGGLLLAVVAGAYRYLRGRDGMGGGDPKLLAALGAWLGWQMLPLTLLIASGSGIIWAVLSHRKKDQPLAQRPVPFGVFLGLSAWMAVLLWPLISGR